MQRTLRTTAAVLAVGLTLVACGNSEGASPATDPVDVNAAPDATDAATSDEAAADESTPDDADADVADTDTGADAAPSEESADDDATSDTGTEADADSGDDTPAAPVEAVIGGRSFASELQPESDFAENLLPDLLVDDIRAGEQINIRNVFPAERPVLIWMWAPH